MENKIKKFFENIEHIKEAASQRVNVMYLTTVCNLTCEYCYERGRVIKAKVGSTLSTREVDRYLSEIMEREKGCVSTLVIMGGETFLKIGMLNYTMDKIKMSDHIWGVSVVTNGTMFKKISGWDYHKILDSTENAHVTLEVSYDGSGHDRRTFPDGESSKERVEEGIEILKEHGMPFRISYTVHRGNYKNLLYDMVWICEKIKPTAIKLSIACQELTDVGIDYEKFKRDFIPYAEHLYLSYEIPICDLACGPCQICDTSNFVGNSYFSPASAGVKFQDAKTEKLFDGF